MTSLNLKGAGVGNSDNEGSRGSHVISTTGEMKFEASDGSLNGTWDGGTLHAPLKGKVDNTDKPCGVESLRKTMENLRISPSLDCNRKWSTLFGSNQKGKEIMHVPIIWTQILGLVLFLF